MNLQALRERLTKTVEINGETLRIRKLSAADGKQLHGIFRGMDFDEDKRQLVKDDEMLRFFAFAASKSIVNEDGRAEFDSDEGRDLLSRMDLAELVEIGEACLEWSGLAGPLEGSKKNESGVT